MLQIRANIHSFIHSFAESLQKQQ